MAHPYMTEKQTGQMDLQKDVREFISTRLPGDLRVIVRRGGYPSAKALRDWIATLGERGWAAPTWPARYGGADLTFRQRAMIEEECVRGDAPPLEELGLSVVGPSLLGCGTEAQKRRYLPSIAAGKESWCQGFSEPEAGSDLASVRTRAIKDGEGWRVDGSKIWTSNAHEADRMLALVRSDPAASRHKGLTMVMIDMCDPGVQVIPIRWMNGVHGYNQVFLDGVRVGRDDVLGPIHGGWSVAMGALGSERVFVARVAENRRLQNRLRTALKDCGAAKSDKVAFEDQAIRLGIRLDALEERFFHFLAKLDAGLELGPEVSMLKLVGSRLIQAFEALEAEVRGPDALPFDPGQLRPGEETAANIVPRLLHHRGYTIAAGASEVQLDVLARRVLEL